MKYYYSSPVVLEASHGIITRIRRKTDNMELFVGQDTGSGGKILSFKWDTKSVGNMYAEIGRPGSCTAISAIVLDTDQPGMHINMNGLNIKLPKAILAFLILISFMAVSCMPERHCRPQFMSGYGDSPKMYK